MCSGGLLQRIGVRVRVRVKLSPAVKTLEGWRRFARVRGELMSVPVPVVELRQFTGVDKVAKVNDKARPSAAPSRIVDDGGIAYWNGVDGLLLGC